MAKLITNTGEEITVDKDQVKELSRFIWRLDSDGYAYRLRYMGKRRRKRRVYLHTTVFPVSKGMICDHRNGERLDCQIENLREVDTAQNTRNMRKHRGQSRYKGVSPVVSRSGKVKWRSEITHNNKKQMIGLWESTDDQDGELFAAISYDIWASKLDAEHYLMNFPDGHELEAQVQAMLDPETDCYRIRRKKEASGPVNVEHDYTGIKFLKDRNTFGAFIQVNGKRIRLGTSKDPTEAALMRDSALSIIHPEAPLNLPGKEPLQHIVEKAHKLLEQAGMPRRRLVNIPEVVEDTDREKPPDFKGVSKRGNTYMAKVKHDGELIHLGSYATPEEAHQVYMKKKAEIRKEKLKSRA